MKTKTLRKKMIAEVPNAMLRSLLEGDTLDVRAIGEPVRGQPGVFQLPDCMDGVDYADVDNAAWIHSIGRHKKTGKILASIDARFSKIPTMNVSGSGNQESPAIAGLSYWENSNNLMEHYHKSGV